MGGAHEETLEQAACSCLSRVKEWIHTGSWFCDGFLVYSGIKAFIRSSTLIHKQGTLLGGPSPRFFNLYTHPRSPMIASTPVHNTDLIVRIQSLCDSGLFVQAYATATPLGPLQSWRGTPNRILAGRLASKLSSHRLGARAVSPEIVP